MDGWMDLDVCFFVCHHSFHFVSIQFCCHRQSTSLLSTGKNLSRLYFRTGKASLLVSMYVCVCVCVKLLSGCQNDKHRQRWMQLLHYHQIRKDQQNQKAKAILKREKKRWFFFWWAWSERKKKKNKKCHQTKKKNFRRGKIKKIFMSRILPYAKNMMMMMMIND